MTETILKELSQKYNEKILEIKTKNDEKLRVIKMKEDRAYDSMYNFILDSINDTRILEP